MRILSARILGERYIRDFRFIRTSLQWKSVRFPRSSAIRVFGGEAAITLYAGRKNVVTTVVFRGDLKRNPAGCTAKKMQNEPGGKKNSPNREKSLLRDFGGEPREHWLPVVLKANAYTIVLRERKIVFH